MNVHIRKKRGSAVAFALSLLITVILLAVPVDRVYAATDSSDTKYITFPYLDTIDTAFEWSFPYSDDFFRTPSDAFNMEMARGSLGLAVSTFRSVENVVKPQYKTYLSGAGFGNLTSFGYDKPTTADTLSGVIGSKKIGNFTVVAAAACGQGYENEWAGNLKVGTGVRHQGFEEASKLLQAQIADYISDNKIKGRIKIWLTGYSRASAVANITAADLIESGDYEDVYAYLFAVPRTTQKPVAYLGIYNFCGQYDPVPGVPLQSWGYERYGKDLYTPSQEASPNYPELKKAANAVCKKQTSIPFRNNPEINYQFYLILQFMGEFFPTADDYATRLQDTLMKDWATLDSEHFTTVLKSAMMSIDTKNSLENHGRLIFIDYLSYIAAQHLRLDQKQVDEGNWNPDESMTANLVLEHRASTYINWLFADLPTEQFLNGPLNCRRITFSSGVSLDVKEDGTAEKSFEPLILKNGSETMLCVPAETEYEITLKREGSRALTYFDEVESPLKLMPDPGTIYFAAPSDSEYTLHLRPAEELPQLTRLDGSSLNAPSALFNASPVSVMKNELDSNDGSYLTLSEALKIVLFVWLGINLLLVACLLMFIAHKRNLKIDPTPYSDLYVIVPHLIIIATFIVLMVFTALNLYPITSARTECASVAMLFVFLLSLRGLLRNRTLRNLLLSVFTLAFTIWLHQYFGGVLLNSHIIVKMIIYTIIVIILSGLAVTGFKKSRKSS